MCSIANLWFVKDSLLWFSDQIKDLLGFQSYGSENVICSTSSLQECHKYRRNLNNKIGIVDCFDSTKDRYRVVLDNLSAGLFKQNNLEILDSQIDFTDLHRVNSAEQHFSRTKERETISSPNTLPWQWKTLILSNTISKQIPAAPWNTIQQRSGLFLIIRTLKVDVCQMALLTLLSMLAQWPWIK